MKAALDSNAKVLASALVGRPQITPLTTTIGTTATTVFNAGTFIAIRVTVNSGGQVACTGDGTTPVIGTSVTTAQYGPLIVWLSQDGDTMPTSSVRCIATATATISTGAI